MYTWDLAPDDKMIVVIKYNGERVMSLFLGEAMESAGRTAVMRHVNACDGSPWLNKWQEEAMESTVRILKGK